MVDTVGVLGVLVGALGFAAALYSIVKQRRVEEQLDRKEELRGLAESLAELRDGVEVLRDSIADPRNDEDQEMEMMRLGKDLIAYHHASGDPPHVVIRDFSAGIGDEATDLDSPEEALEELKSGRSVWMTFQIANTNDLRPKFYGYDLGNFHTGFRFVFRDLRELESEYSEILSQFDPDLLEDVDEAVSQAYLERTRKAMSVYELELEPTHYADSETMADNVYETFYHYDDYERDVERLNEIVEDIERVRKSTIQTSFS